MDEDIKLDIAVIKEKMQNMNSQLDRFISHLESEQRVTSNISKRVDTLQFQVETMAREKSEAQSGNRWRFEQIVSILALIGTLGTLIVMVIKG